VLKENQLRKPRSEEKGNKKGTKERREKKGERKEAKTEREINQGTLSCTQVLTRPLVPLIKISNTNTIQEINNPSYITMPCDIVLAIN